MSEFAIVSLMYIGLIVPQFILGVHLATKNPKTPVVNAMNAIALFVTFSIITFVTVFIVIKPCDFEYGFECFGSQTVALHLLILMFVYGGSMMLCIPILVRHFVAYTTGKVFRMWWSKNVS